MRILIIGLGCSGKSTLARQIGELTGLPVYHLDRYLWKTGWIRVNEQEFLITQEKILSKQDWVYEGFNPQSFTMQISYAEVIIYLKKTHLRITLNWLKRLWKYRNHSRPDMADGNIETFKWTYLKWLWKYDNNKIIDEVNMLANNKEVVILTSTANIHAYLTQFRRKS